MLYLSKTLQEDGSFDELKYNEIFTTIGEKVIDGSCKDDFKATADGACRTTINHEISPLKIFRDDAAPESKAQFLAASEAMAKSMGDVQWFEIMTSCQDECSQDFKNRAIPQIEVYEENNSNPNDVGVVIEGQPGSGNYEQQQDSEGNDIPVVEINPLDLSQIITK